MDYTTLVASNTTAGSISNWLNNGQITAVASIIIQEAESFIYRRLRHWRMLVENTALVTVVGSDSVSLTTLDNSRSAFLEMKSLYVTGTNMAKLTMKTEQEVKAAYSYDASGVRVQAPPTIYYITAISGVPTVKLDTSCDQVYPLETVFFQQPAALSGTNLTNFITDNFPRLMRAACMVGASEFMKDVGAGNFDRTYWEQNCLAEIAIAQEESDRFYRAMEVGMMLQ